MPFDHLLIFGEAGNGDLWVFGILMDGQIQEWQVYAWDHETDGRPWIAAGLADLIARVESGLIDADG